MTAVPKYIFLLMIWSLSSACDVENSGSSDRNNGTPPNLGAESLNQEAIQPFDETDSLLTEEVTPESEIEENEQTPTDEETTETSSANSNAALDALLAANSDSTPQEILDDPIDPSTDLQCPDGIDSNGQCLGGQTPDSTDGQNASVANTDTEAAPPADTDGTETSDPANTTENGAAPPADDSLVASDLIAPTPPQDDEEPEEVFEAPLPPVSVDVYRVYSDALRDNALILNPADQRFAGYKILSRFRLLRNPISGQTNTLYLCKVGPDHFVSGRADCEGQRMIFKLGHSYREPQRGTVRLARCNNFAGNHLTTLESGRDCSEQSGYREEGSPTGLGYVFPLTGTQ